MIKAFNKRKSFTLIFLLFSLKSLSQIPFIATSQNVSNQTSHYDGLIEANGKILGITKNPFTSTVFDFRLFDTQGNLLLVKSYTLYNAASAASCGVISTSGGRIFRNKIHYNSIDSTYTISGTFYEQYGSCPQAYGSFIMCINSNLDILWHKEFSNFDEDVVFFNDSIAFAVEHYRLIKLNYLTGNVIWAKSVPGIGSPMYGVEKSLSDTSVIIYGGPPAAFEETDPDGNVISARIFSDSVSLQTDRQVAEIVKTNDSCYVLLSSRNDNTVHSFFSLTKVNGNGNIIWDKDYTMPGRRLLNAYYSQSFDITQDSGFLIPFAIHDTIAGSGFSRTSLLKLDKNGDIVWNKMFDGSNLVCNNISSISSIMQSLSGGIIFGGTNFGKLDAAADGCFFIACDSIVQNNANSVIGTIAISLTASSVSQVFGRTYLLQSTDNTTILETCSPSAIENGSLEVNNISIAPNPSAGKLSVNYKFQSGKTAVLKIIDVNGKSVFISDLAANSTLVNIDVSYLENGIYTLMIFSDNFNISKRLVILSSD